MNLVKNAIKFTDSGKIEYGYEYVAENMDHTSLLRFYVKDSGIGIPKDRQNAIFDRFVQADISDTRAFQGAGLGLSISKAYVEMLGGKIWLDTAEGKGSTFYFTIPYSSVKEAISKTNNDIHKIEIDNKIKKLKILIVEDDKASEILITRAVKPFSSEILKADTGIKAIETCRNNPDLDLILMDIKMPGFDGYEATRQIRKFNKNVIIIAQTAFALIGDREKALSAGCNDYLTKPTRNDLLVSTISNQFAMEY